MKKKKQKSYYALMAGLILLLLIGLALVIFGPKEGLNRLYLPGSYSI